jgi:hypothetical protein
MRIARTLPAAAIVLATLPAAAGAATIPVSVTPDNKTDDQQCTLREAVDAANLNAAVNPAGGNDCPAGASGELDTIQLQASTYPLTGAANENANASGDLDVNPAGGPVLIKGGPTTSSSIVDANGFDRAFEFLSSVQAATIDTVTIREGLVDGGILEGGGIRTLSQLTIRNSRIQDNAVVGTGFGMTGGGITVTGGGDLILQNSGVFSNDLTHDAASANAGYAVGGGGIGFGISAGNTGVITDSQIEDNHITNPQTGFTDAFLSGGGIYHASSGLAGLTIARSTITGNDLTGGQGSVGAGINFSHQADAGQLRIDNSTFAFNSSGPSEDSSLGGGLAVVGGVTDVAFTSFADNSATSGQGVGIEFSDGMQDALSTFEIRNSVLDDGGTADCTSPQGDLTSLGGNVERGATGECNFTHPTDALQNTEILDSLTPANGGPTETMQLLSNSTAINRIAPAACLDSTGAASPADQRGFARVGNCDSGAVEFGSTGPPPPIDPVNPGGGQNQPGGAAGKKCKKKKAKKKSASAAAKKKKKCKKKKRK